MCEDKIIEAFEYLKGYCKKHKSCDNCRFVKDNGWCSLKDSIPCDWYMRFKDDDRCKDEDWI